MGSVMSGDDRRTVLKLISIGAGAITGGIVALPAIGAVLAPFRKTTVTGAGTFVPVAALELVPDDGTPAKVPVVIDAPKDAWTTLPPTEIGAVFLVKQAGSVVAYSTVCPHLGCGVDYVAAKKVFACPCHDSAFGPDGQVSSGPSPRGLDRLETRVEGGKVEVRFVRFAQGTSEKVPV